MNKRKYRKGGHILTLDELAKQECVYFREKVQHRGWFCSWQLRFAIRNIGENGHIYYAEKVVPDKIVCNNCGKRFSDEKELKKYVEVFDFRGGSYTVEYSESLWLEEDDKYSVFDGCPNCRTDKYLMDLE